MENKLERQSAEEFHIRRVMGMIETELRSATAMHGSMPTFHHGYAVILEELDELKEWVWTKASKRDHVKMTHEATQVGAMAARFLMDLC